MHLHKYEIAGNFKRDHGYYSNLPVEWIEMALAVCVSARVVTFQGNRSFASWKGHFSCPSLHQQFSEATIILLTYITFTSLLFLAKPCLHATNTQPFLFFSSSVTNNCKCFLSLIYSPRQLFKYYLRVSAIIIKLMATVITTSTGNYC